MRVEARPARAAIRLLSFVIASALTFGLSLGAVAFIQGGPSLPIPVQPLTPGFSWDIARYATFHWLLLALVSFPVFLLPLVALALVDGRSGRALPYARKIVVIVVLAALGVIFRTALLERPTLFASPSQFVSAILFNKNALCEWLAFVGGLVAANAWSPARGLDR